MIRRLDRDVLYLIFEELQYDKRTLHSCLLINRTWCETIIPILWRNPWGYNLNIEKEKLLSNIIISHLSNKSKISLKPNIIYQKPLFNYIIFCKHLNLSNIQKIISIIDIESEMKSIKKEIITLFIKRNTKFTHISIPYKFDFQLHLIPRAKDHFSDIKFLSCSTCVNNNILIGIMKICKSIKELELIVGEDNNNNNGIIKLIKSQKNLLNINLIYPSYTYDDKSFGEILENSLINHSNTIEYIKINKSPFTKILTSFINLQVLELDNIQNTTLDYLENLSLPYLRSLRTKSVSIEVSTILIKSTGGFLNEIKIDSTFGNVYSNNRIIQAIYNNCPFLKYLKLILLNDNISELEKLIINCNYLNGLFIIIDSLAAFDWDNLFKILTESSPNSLFKFKFYSYVSINLGSLKQFFENWKGKHPMLLQLSRVKNVEDLIVKYKKKGRVKIYNNNVNFDEGFEWI
ncbi:hypothetical protein RhiirA1_539833 [Rhizophagus irregularis]|uniref:F-box domain-containing protein n=1 Tax=Rhizophagus irregularis TaxID=588596 RepID=A0A2N0RAX4_9GLOM|nr:hypothetical protein RhiirA1_539833 [Rhizophagus irregularis]